MKKEKGTTQIINNSFNVKENNGTIINGDNNFFETLGANIKKQRELKNKTQQELANEVGYKSISAVSQIEKGTRAIPIEKLTLISSVLNTTPNELLNWKGKGWEDTQGREEKGIDNENYNSIEQKGMIYYYDENEQLKNPQLIRYEEKLYIVEIEVQGLRLMVKDVYNEEEVGFDRMERVEKLGQFKGMKVEEKKE